MADSFTVADLEYHRDVAESYCKQARELADSSSEAERNIAAMYMQSATVNATLAVAVSNYLLLKEQRELGTAQQREFGEINSNLEKIHRQMPSR